LERTCGSAMGGLHGIPLSGDTQIHSPRLSF
jgi:hypothetical protein